MKKIFISLVILAGMTSLQASAFDWTSVLNFIGKASETQTYQTQSMTLSDLEKQMAAIDNSAKSAFVDMVSELSGWKETRNIKSQLKPGNEVLTEVVSGYANTYIANNRQNIINKIQKMSAKEKGNLTSNLATLTECGQNYLLLAANGAKTASKTLKAAQTVSDVATTITNINRTAAELKQRATTVVTLVNQVKTIATAAGMSIN